LPSGNSIRLLFSAKTSDELIFKDKFDKISDPNFKATYFVTASGRKDRIDKQVLENSVDSFCRSKPVFCFVCGPNSMIKSVESELVNLGVDKRHIFYEVWW
jgi:ferredoxin-NADP reductase